MPQVTLYGTANCPRCNALKHHLECRHVEHTYVDIRQDEEAAQKLIDLDLTTLPVLLKEGEYYADSSIQKMLNFARGN